jgi:PEP-CTERM motif
VGAGGQDQLLLSGQAWLDGTLDLQFDTGLSALSLAGSPSWTLMQWQGYSGQFDRVNVTGLGAEWTPQLNYSASGLTLTLAPVPEPGSVALMLAGLLGLAGWARRRAATA